jgi:cytochrome P450
MALRIDWADSTNTNNQLWVVFGTIVLYQLWRFIWHRRQFLQQIEKIPGPSLAESHPILAHAYPFTKSIGTVPGHPKLPKAVPLLQNLAQEFQPYGIFRLWVFHPYIPFARTVIYILDPQLVKQFLTDPLIQSKICKERQIYNIAKSVVGDSFLSLPDGKEWKHQRKLAAAGFHQRFLELASQTAVQLLKEKVFPTWDAALLQDHKQQPQSDNGETASAATTTTSFTLEAAQWSTRLILEILGHVAFSCSFGGLDPSHDDSTQNQQQQEEENLYKIYQVILTIVFRRFRSPPILPYFWFRDNIRFQKCCRRLDSTIETIVRKRLADLDSNDEKNKHQDLLSYLMIPDDQGQRLSYQYLFGNTRMFLFAGHDTTAAILSNALWELATHPQIQARLQAELDPLFDTTENKPTYKDLMQLKYLDAVVKEALRLHASAGVARQVNDDIKLQKEVDKGGGIVQEYVLPKGSYVYIFPMFAHRLEKYYSDPLEFSPERFLGSESATNTKKWYPFSWGARNCVGQPLAIAELKTILAHILRQYKVSRNARAIDPIPVVMLTIKPHTVVLDIQKRY